MPLKHDDQGFLVGDLIDLNRELVAGQEEGLTLLKSINQGVLSMTRAARSQRLNKAVYGGIQRPVSEPLPRVLGPSGREALKDPAGAAIERERGAKILAELNRKHLPVREPAGVSGNLAENNARIRKLYENPAFNFNRRDADGRYIGGPNNGYGPRDSKGRFLPGQGPKAGGASDATSSSSGSLGTAFGHVGSAVQGGSQLDPMLMAAQEARTVLEPLGRQWGAHKRHMKKEEGFWKKLLKLVTPGKRLNKNAGNFAGFPNTAPAPGLSLRGAGGLLSGAGGLLGLLVKGLGGLLGRAGGVIKGAPGVGGMLSGGSSMLKAGGGLLKRVPLLGALLAGGGALAAMMGGDDPTKSAEENRSERYRGTGEALGMGAGGLLGAAVGSLLGPVGTIAGAYVGSMLGEVVGAKMGEWTKSLIDADIPGQIKGGWDSVVASGKAALDRLVVGLGGVLKGANDAVTRATGVDLKATVTKGAANVAAKATEVRQGALAAASTAAAKVNAAGTSAMTAVAGAAATATNQAKQGASAVKDAVVAAAPALVPNTIRRLAGKGANAVMLAQQAGADGITDPKKLALFMGQMSHESQSFTRLEENLNYRAPTLRAKFSKYYKDDAAAEADVAAGPEAIANRVYGGRMGNVDPGDGYKYRGRGFVQLTGRENYRAAGNDLGLDLEKNPELAADPANAARVASWYWKKRVASRGADNSLEASTRAINGGLNGIEDRMERVAQYQSLIGPSQPVMGMAKLNFAVPSIPAPSIASIPPIPEVNIPERLNTDEPPLTVVVQRAPVGQNVGDRGIAHVVTGGLGRS